MTRIAYLLIVTCVLFSSCATVFNKNTKAIKIINHVDSGLVLLNSTDTVYSGVNTFDVMRSNRDVNISVTRPNHVENVSIKSELDPLCVVGNLYPLYGLGWLVDLTNQKRFTYKKFNHIYLDNGSLILDQPALPINLFGGINGINLNKFYTRQSNFSVMSIGGFSMGAEVYIKPQLYLSGALQVNIPYSEIGNNEHGMIFGLMGNILINRTFDRFHMGIGIDVLSLENKNNNYYTYNNVQYNYNNTRVYGPGFAAELQFRFYDSFYVSGSYNSVIYNWKNNKLSNTSVIALGIKYKFEMGNLDDKRFMNMMKR